MPSNNNPSANTPDPPNPISINDVKRVFGKGQDKFKNDDLNDFHGIAYWDTFYPYKKGKFEPTFDTQLSLQDFYSKTSEDPVIPGKLEDYTPGGPKAIDVPVFRNFIVIDVWGAGGGGGAGDHDGTPAPGGTGGASSFGGTIGGSTFTVTSNGGAGATGGYRYGNQNGSGGGGGTFANTGTVVGTFVNRQNGNSGAGGDAGAGRGGNGGASPSGGAGGLRGGSKEPTKTIHGKPGNAPGGGGGGGGSSDFQSGKNANPNRAAGGGGGGGAYQRLYITRAQITPGTKLIYTIGAGGSGTVVPNNRSLGNGAAGSSGGFRLFYDKTDAPLINYQKILISDWAYHFGGCFGAGYNDLYLHIASSAFTVHGKTTGAAGGIMLTVTGAAADYTVASPGYAGRWSPAGHTSVADPNYYYNSNIMLNGSPFQDFTSPWWSSYAAGRDNMAFRIITNWDDSRGILEITIEGDCKGGRNKAYQIGDPIFPTIGWSGI